MIALTREEVQQVLEYVECVPDDRLNVEHIDRDALVETLRARLAEPPERVTKEMLQAQVNALIALQKIQDSRHEREARLAEPEKKQEPVAWDVFVKHSYIYFSIGNQSFQLAMAPEDEPDMSAGQIAAWYMTQLRNALARLASTLPPQRPWQGLTDEEIKGVLETTHPENRWTIAERIEAKLKEKNT